MVNQKPQPSHLSDLKLIHGCDGAPITGLLRQSPDPSPLEFHLHDPPPWRLLLPELSSRPLAPAAPSAPRVQGDWEAVAKVRLGMKELDIRKDPRSSWITVNEVTHEFIVEDKSHPQYEEIFSVLEEMSSKLRALSYVPEISGVLPNIDQEENESTLIYHSEKIALAFVLINTRPRMALHVVKNLCVCVDCHSSIKLISKIYGRRIVVRDWNQFHHFEEGH